MIEVLRDQELGFSIQWIEQSIFVLYNAAHEPINTIYIVDDGEPFNIEDIEDATKYAYAWYYGDGKDRVLDWQGRQLQHES